ncbi:alkylresorcinol/alkylpyrone synthase [Virgibacillus natechei]|uniref:Alkylresorcinol/alkylpyrone synthase n=1 Tax=Virgibacillus natechei TaxID=1216297 RepID=A0ABS4IB43_9BACI|nr:3-oxoacyl-[acyl-carrier-protein] synthase III C-terminal domain-containing protein [Virgibacillus natechei]MBP1967910.1 alkylresorcinol/alkylpyrone synthase [Virgibacillus natechei]UZD14797.1 type III polyketide synthase [Virgibacillus natechei]
MAFIGSVGLSIPKNNLSQDEVKELVLDVFSHSTKRVNRLLPVFDNAEIDNRQFVVDKKWLKESHTFKEKNDLYQTFAKKHMLQAVDHCLSNQEFLTEDIPYEAVDMIIFVSSTGIATPSMEVHLLNERPFSERTSRMPLWGLGCAGGAIGLSRAFDWIAAHPEKTALIVCCELCSLTFQKEDMKKSNLIGSALFGDGISAVLAIGEKSPFLSYRKRNTPKIRRSSSLTKKNSTSVMGWNINNSGLEVIFSKSIPAMVNSFWDGHIHAFMRELGLNEKMIHSFIAHPGGKKVLNAMEDVIESSSMKFSNSYKVLRNHGNMSSATVFYVLYEAMKENTNRNELSILSALGPGFSSELLLLEWN